MYADNARHTGAADRRGAPVAGVQVEDGHDRCLAAGVDAAQTHRPVESYDGTREAGDRPSEVASPFALVIFIDTSVWVEALRSRQFRRGCAFRSCSYRDPGWSLERRRRSVASCAVGASAF